MNTTEVGRVAAAINLLRPDWPAESLQTFIVRNLGARPYRDAAVALAYVACDPESQTPARVLSAGPWWRSGTSEPEPTRHTNCPVCGELVPNGIHPPSLPCPGPRHASRSDRTAEHLAALRTQVRPCKAPDHEADKARATSEEHPA